MRSKLDDLCLSKSFWEEFFLSNLVHQTERKSPLAYALCAALEKDQGFSLDRGFPLGTVNSQDGKKYERCQFSMGEKNQAAPDDWAFLQETFPKRVPNCNFTSTFLGHKHSNLMTLADALSQPLPAKKLLTFYYLLQQDILPGYFSKFFDAVPEEMLPEFFARLFYDQEHEDDYKKALNTATSPLFMMGLLTFEGSVPVIGKRLYDLLGNEEIEADEIISKILGKPGHTDLGMSDFLHFGDVIGTIVGVLRSALKSGQKGVNILLYGPAGSGKTELAKTIAKEVGCQIYSVAEDEGLGGGDARPDKDRDEDSSSGRSRLSDDSTQRMGELLRAQALLEGNPKAMTLFDEIEDLLPKGGNSDDPKSKIILNRLLENNRVPTIWCGNNAEKFHPAVRQRFTISLNVGFQPTLTRAAIWKTQLRLQDVKLDDGAVTQLAREFIIPPRIIQKAVFVYKQTGDIMDIRRTIAETARITYGGVSAITSEHQVCAGFNPALLNIAGERGAIASFIQAAKSRKPAALAVETEGGMGERDLVHFMGEEGLLHVMEVSCMDLAKPSMSATPEQKIQGLFSGAAANNMLVVINDMALLTYDSDGEGNKPLSNRLVETFRSAASKHTLPFVLISGKDEKIPQEILHLFPEKIMIVSLTAEGAEEMYEIAFGGKPPEALKTLDKLTVADFFGARRVAEMKGIKDPQAILGVLRQQCEVRASKGGHSFGFNQS